MLPDEGVLGNAVLRVVNDLPAAGYAEAGIEMHLVPFVRPIVQRLDEQTQVLLSVRLAIKQSKRRACNEAVVRLLRSC